MAVFLLVSLQNHQNVPIFQKRTLNSRQPILGESANPVPKEARQPAGRSSHLYPVALVSTEKEEATPRKWFVLLNPAVFLLYKNRCAF